MELFSKTGQLLLYFLPLCLRQLYFCIICLNSCKICTVLPQSFPTDITGGLIHNTQHMSSATLSFCHLQIGHNILYYEIVIYTGGLLLHFVGDICRFQPGRNPLHIGIGTKEYSTAFALFKSPCNGLLHISVLTFLIGKCPYHHRSAVIFSLQTAAGSICFLLNTIRCRTQLLHKSVLIFLYHRQ